MAKTAGTELDGPAAFGKFRIVRRLKSAAGHERAIALASGDSRELLVERFAVAGLIGEAAQALRERAERLKTIASPHLARIVETVSDDRELIVAQMNFAGEWLEELTFAEAKAGSNFIALAVNLRIVLDVLAGLSAVHTQKVPSALTHGTVAPCNLLVGTDGHTRLTGFLRPPTARMGSAAAYAAPEILLQDGTADERADLYSASVLLWEALAGKPLFEDPDPQAVLARQLAGPLPPASVREPWAEPLVAVAAKGLAVSPGERYRSASEIATAIRSVAQARLAAPSRVGRMVEALAESALVRRKSSMPAAELEATVEVPAPLAAAPPPTFDEDEAPTKEKALNDSGLRRIDPAVQERAAVLMAPTVPLAFVPIPVAAMPVTAKPAPAIEVELDSADLSSIPPPSIPISTETPTVTATPNVTVPATSTETPASTPPPDPLATPAGMALPSTPPQRISAVEALAAVPPKRSRTPLIVVALLLLGAGAFAAVRITSSKPDTTVATPVATDHAPAETATPRIPPPPEPAATATTAPKATATTASANAKANKPPAATNDTPPASAAADGERKGERAGGSRDTKTNAPRSKGDKKPRYEPEGI